MALLNQAERNVQNRQPLITPSKNRIKAPDQALLSQLSFASPYLSSAASSSYSSASAKANPTESNSVCSSFNSFDFNLLKKTQPQLDEKCEQLHWKNQALINNYLSSQHLNTDGVGDRDGKL
jgi:ATP-dependent helicase/DNAse subunit B